MLLLVGVSVLENKGGHALLGLFLAHMPRCFTCTGQNTSYYTSSAKFRISDASFHTPTGPNLHTSKLLSDTNLKREDTTQKPEKVP